MLKIAIGIATTGRREQMPLTLGQIDRLSRAPLETIVCPASEEDFDASITSRLKHTVKIVSGPRGSCAQRNAIIRACGDIDILVFMDDDFYPAPDYLAQVAALFASLPDVVVATNQPALDGTSGPGVAHEAAMKVLDGLTACAAGGGQVRDTYGGYGCNMALRLSAVRRHGVWFDERLPLYGWLEDIDFTRRLGVAGRIVESSALQGVHLATKRGKTSGLRLGYSQIANPVYLAAKGSMSMRYGYSQALRNTLKNAARTLHPEPWVDRKGRLKGNLLALRDLVTGRLDPSNILSFEQR